jgi:putative oxidoreductase
MSDSSQAAKSPAEWAATLLRIALGALFLSHGLIKLLVFTPAGTYAFFEKLGLPGVLGYATMAAECAIGTALILGLFTRLAALAGIPILVGALVAVHIANGFSAGRNGWEFVGFWVVALLVQVMLGDGKLALGRHLPFPSHHDHSHA